MLFAIRTSDDPLSSSPRSLLAWLVPVSLALHAGAIALMPSRAVHRPPPPPPVVVETSEPPPPPASPPAPPEETAAPEPPAHRMPSAMRATTSPARAATEPTPATASDDAPVDFTGMTFSSEGPGVAVESGRAGRPAAPAAPTAASPARVVASVPVVPASALARPPRAPGLDAELERNYPPEARRSGISGTAALRVELLHDGRIGKVELVSESHSGFGAACERTVRAGRWEPPIDREGRPVRTEIEYVCRFEVRS